MIINNNLVSTSSSAGQDRLNVLVAKARSLGHRLTPQRLAILRVLASSREHPDAERIHEQIKPNFPTTSIATVYKTIAMLKDMGEVLELAFPNGSNRYDGVQSQPHPHLVCVKCGRILDPDIPSLDELPVQVARATGYEIISHRLDLYGICPACREQTSDTSVSQRA